MPASPIAFPAHQSIQFGERFGVPDVSAYVGFTSFQRPTARPIGMFDWFVSPAALVGVKKSMSRHHQIEPIMNLQLISLSSPNIASGFRRYQANRFCDGTSVDLKVTIGMTNCFSNLLVCAATANVFRYWSGLREILGLAPRLT